MNKKIIIIGIMCIFITLGLESIGVNAVKRGIERRKLDVLSNNEFNNIFNFIDKNSINVDKELIKNLFSYSYNSGALWSSTYNFEPCNSIDIEGLGDVGEEGILAYVVINEGSVNINGVYSNQFIDGEIKCICVFFYFDGSLIFDPDTKYSKLKGDADLGYLIEYSLLVSLDLQKSEF